MRDIRFRAWNGEGMEYGGFAVHATSGMILPTPLTRVNELSPLMQYTGLKDKHGKEIFEGDVLKVNGADVGAVFYCDGAFEICKDETRGFINRLYAVAPEFVEVIGNIYESPELLNEP